MNVLITAGEASGDLYGAGLAKALSALDPGVKVSGIGGPRMRRAGVSLLHDTSAWGSIGIVNALKILPRAELAYFSLRRHLRKAPPDVLVPIDFGTFNTAVGRYARSLGIPVYYFIAPGSWRKTGPIRPSLLRAADVFCAQLPWHAERLRNAGAQAEFFGHPLLDVAHPSAPADALRREWGLPAGAPVLCLLPGSRRHEVEHILPAFLDAGARIRKEVPDVRFVLGLAEVVDGRQVARILRSAGWASSTAPPSCGVAARPETAPEPKAEGPGLEVLIATGRTYDCLSVATAALCASGTVTLEAAIFGVPQVIAYRGSAGMWLQYQFIKHKIGYMGLPNLYLDAPVCPELKAEQATPEAIAAAALPLVQGGPAAQAQKEAMARVRELLGDFGAIQRAAQRILEIGAGGRMPSEKRDG